MLNRKEQEIDQENQGINAAVESRADVRKRRKHAADNVRL